MSESKKVALPAYLPRRLQAFRIVQGDTTTYLLRDKLADKTHDLEPWQFFVLEVLPGCETIGKLLSVFEDRFGRQLSEAEVMKFFGWLADNKLLEEESAAHPLLKPFTKQSYALEHGLVKPKSFEELATTMAPATTMPSSAFGPATSEAKEGVPEDATLAAGVNEAENLDPRAAGRAWKLFEIKPMLAALLPLVSPLKWVVYLLPFLGLSALILAVRYAPLAYEDLATLNEVTTLLAHAITSLLGDQHPGGADAGLHRPGVSRQRRPAEHRPSLRLLPALHGTDSPHRPAEPARADVAARRAAADARVSVQRRRARLVQHPRHVLRPCLAPGSRSPSSVRVNIVLAGGNPLVKGNGYHLLAAFMNEPYLRGKSYKAFMSKLRGGSASEADSSVLVTYALLNFLYAFVVVAVIVMIVTKFVAHLQVGGATIIVVLVLAGYLLRRTAQRFGRISTAYEQSVQFDRWRRRAMPAEGGEAKQVETQTSRTTVYVRTAVLVSLLLLLFLPYRYEAGGTLRHLPERSPGDHHRRGRDRRGGQLRRQRIGEEGHGHRPHRRHRPEVGDQRADGEDRRAGRR